VETVNCHLCGASDRRVRYRGRDLLHGTRGEFTIVECVSCGFLYLSPRPDQSEIDRYYPSDYMPFRRPLQQESSAVHRYDRGIGLRRRCRMIQRWKQTGSLLDVGCGTGDFLVAMRSVPGWSVRGLEPSSGAAEQARALSGLEVDQVFLDQAEYPAGSFDVVTLFDVFEHLPDPREALRRINNWLRPDGVVVLGLPNRRSVEASFFGEYWAGLDVPRHFSIFSPGDVRRLLRETGYAAPEIFNLTGGYFSFVLSVGFWLVGSERPTWQRAAVNSILRSLPVRAFAFPSFMLLKWLRLGSTMIIVARKE